MIVELNKRAPRGKRTQMDTIELTKEQLAQWKAPPFQRPVRVNEKVLSVVDDLRTDGVMPGILTLGVIEQGRERGTYLLDGQHRGKAFELSDVESVLADVRVITFDSLAEMGEAFVELNSSLVTMRPDDILRGMEGAIEALQIVRRDCPFVGYDMIRRNTHSSILGMSAVLRAWHGSSGETPGNPSIAAIRLAQETTPESARMLVDFLKIAFDAWGREENNFRLWAGLNMTICMWLYRRLVLERERGIRRYVILHKEEFKRCLMSLAATASYVDWLYGRAMKERDRSPAYGRIKEIFSKRLSDERKSRVLLPSPQWDIAGGKKNR
jgi:hypothetical protein